VERQSSGEVENVYITLWQIYSRRYTNQPKFYRKYDKNLNGHDIDILKKNTSFKFYKVV